MHEYNNKNYQIYVPEKNIIIGYFSDEKLTPSEENFCKEIYEQNKIDDLKQKINQGKFVKEINLERHSLEALTSSYKTFEICFENISKRKID